MMEKKQIHISNCIHDEFTGLSTAWSLM